LGWFSTKACGVKLPVVCDPGADCPLYAALRVLNVNDITAAEDMPIDSIATHVFDFGYYDDGGGRSSMPPEHFPHPWRTSN
jgi:hypothetical protein